MELSKPEIHSLEQIILHSEIPYEDVKIELLDRLATEIEIRMESNPDLSFSDALRLSATDVKEEIISIQKDIERRENRQSIVDSFGFRNIKSTVLFMFFTIATYGCFHSLGTWGAPIASSIVTFTIISIVIAAIRLRFISSPDSLQLKYRMQNFWIPLLLAALITMMTSFIFIEIINQGHFWTYINKLLVIPVSLAYGFFFKVIIHVPTSGINDIRTRVELDKKFLELV